MLWDALHAFRTLEQQVMSADFKQVDAARAEAVMEECQRNAAKASRNLPESQELCARVRAEI